ncbi:MAG: amidohydrolase family protein [Candidatus Nezhaarchaeota archaeon]|nr:amidohydrolase family protein [Candidatus Nezhaarchaeota archaeon]
MIVNVKLALLGEDLNVRRRISIEFEDGIIESIVDGFRSGGLTFKNGVALPALVNAHIHVLDFAFQEVGLNLRLSKLVSEPHGLKHKLIAKLNPYTVLRASLSLFNRLVKQGVYTAIVFCERFEIIDYMKQASRRANLNAVILTRPKKTNSTLLIDEALRNSNGLGLDSPLRYDVNELVEMRDKCAKKGLLKAVHVSETPETHEKGDFKLALNFLESDLMVHGVYLEEDEIRELSSRGVSLAICPRSNMWFSSGLPPLSELFKHNVNMVLGTDNAGWVNPDIWRELETLFNVARLQGLRLDPRELLKIATVNVNKVRNLKVPSNILEEGSPANFIVLSGEELGLRFSRNVYASIVKRGSAEAVIFRSFSS